MVDQKKDASMKLYIAACITSGIYIFYIGLTHQPQSVFDTSPFDVQSVLIAYAIATATIFVGGAMLESDGGYQKISMTAGFFMVLTSLFPPVVAWVLVESFI